MAGGLLAGSGLEENLFTVLVESTESKTVFEERGGKRLLDRIRSGDLSRGGYVVVADGGDTRFFIVAYNGRIVYAEASQAGRLVKGDEALRLLEGYNATLRVGVGRLRPRLVEWSPSLSVYVRGIDLQHRQLINTLNSLYQALLLGGERRQVGWTLGFLEEYSRFHFRTEENFLQRHGYPQLEQHRREHRWFVEKVNRLREEHRRGERELGLEMLAFLARWVRGHIAGSDRRYAEWLRSKGLA
ncbi:MAG: hemerythrin family protein [Crenarchaeota archaeon]|nr:hemerythrin family protein [Thermoproteota archaeon]